MSVKQHEDRSDLHYVAGLLAVEIAGVNRQERAGALERLIAGNEGWRAASRADLVREFGDSPVDRVMERIDVLQVEDPVAAARRLADQPGVIASPIHALGFSWHRPMSGLRPGETVDASVLPSVRAGGDRVIAVVDTGVVGAAMLPSWMSTGIIRGQHDIDGLEEGDLGSHGTFVASLLRQIAPSHTVSMAKAGSLNDDHEDDAKRGASHPEPNPTTEFHVADAIHRLIERHRGDNCVVEALNLSLGGPIVDGMTMVTVRSAIARWRETFPRAPIFAAAGNTDGIGRIYPAAFGHVRGVSAAANGGGQVVWDEKDKPRSPSSGRDWVDDVAPGMDLIGLSGLSIDEAISWSGSSFATAVATASHVNGGPVEVRGNLAYWPNERMLYGDVPGLTYV
jgi:hypothetical protein